MLRSKRDASKRRFDDVNLDSDSFSDSNDSYSDDETYEKVPQTRLKIKMKEQDPGDATSGLDTKVHST